MSTTKSHGIIHPSTTNMTSSHAGKSRDDLTAFKNKALELERQVNEYKTKLEELRRAKPTTVVKHEKEYINASVPGTSRPEKAKPCEKCEELERMLETERKSSAQLKKMIEPKDQSKAQLHSSSSIRTNNNGCSTCSDLKQLLDIEKENNLQLAKQLQSQRKQTEQEHMAKQIFEQSIEIMQSDIIEEKRLSEKLRAENQTSKNQFEAIKREHSEKMAELCDREEHVKKQIDIWEQMYAEWLATMERRVNNLQVTDVELQAWLRHQSERR